MTKGQRGIVGREGIAQWYQVAPGNVDTLKNK